jgi:hypothetical protein
VGYEVREVAGLFLVLEERGISEGWGKKIVGGRSRAISRAEQVRAEQVRYYQVLEVGNKGAK